LPLGIQLIDGSTNGITISSAGTTQINDGSFGGLAKTQVLQEQLNNTNAYITALYTACSGLAAALDALAPGALAAFNSATAGQTLGDYSQIENSDVTHGPKSG